jgi:uncharacterized protein (TIGR00369 family)
MKKELEQEFVDFARSRVKRSKFSELMGFEVEKLFAGGAVVSMRTEDHHRQIHNVMHGGVLAALADTAAAIAAYTVVPRGAEVVTVELKINYLLPVAAGKVCAEGRVLRAGRNFVVVECDVTNQEAMVAKALMTFGAAPGHQMGRDQQKKSASRKPARRAKGRSSQ